MDDGSRDGTAALAEKFAPRACHALLRNPGNRGKGYAVRHGMLEARGEWACSPMPTSPRPSRNWKSCGPRRERESAQ